MAAITRSKPPRQRELFPRYSAGAKRTQTVARNRVEDLHNAARKGIKDLLWIETKYKTLSADIRELREILEELEDPLENLRRKLSPDT